MNKILTSAMSWLLSFSHFDVSGKAKLCFMFQTAVYVPIVMCIILQHIPYFNPTSSTCSLGERTFTI